ncbi:MAG: hypothetical protein E7632_03415 [Ruminococcaceae bacterium]|nr:hypothetical protein [Oscillospiraceae bacterium]
MAKKTEGAAKVCEFCRFCEAITGTEDMLCEHLGVVSREHTCRRFVYDPLKRVPRRLPELVVPDDLAEL